MARGVYSGADPSALTLHVGRYCSQVMSGNALEFGESPECAIFELCQKIYTNFSEEIVRLRCIKSSGR